MLTESVPLETKNYLIFDATQDNEMQIKSQTIKHGNEQNIDAFHSNELVDMVLKSLNKPRMEKSIPGFLLYDAVGLQLFDKLTQSGEYYLTNAERSILLERADEIANRVNDNSIVFELGSGSLCKTQLILQALEKQRKRVTYYALDLNRQELDKSLASLGTEYQYIKLVGLMGTYEQGMQWLQHQYEKKRTQKLVLWLGSSIGNVTHSESIDFLGRLRRTCLQSGDLCLIGFDRQKDASVISKAYCNGISREFVLNGLTNVNRLLGQSLFNPNDFTFDSNYQISFGRQAAYYRALKSVNLIYNRSGQSFDDNEQLVIPIEKDEMIHAIYSHKYSDKEIMETLNGAGLNLVCKWSDANDFYRLTLSECSNENDKVTSM